MEKIGDSDHDLQRELKTCAVLGGRGFIGRALVGRLLGLGNWAVRVVDSVQPLQIDASESLLNDEVSCDRASYFNVDFRSKLEIVKAIEGSSVVFYTDSIESLPNEFFLSYKIVVQGAKNVINACKECKVKHLIYSSSADVVYRNMQDIRNGDESMPHSDKFRDILTDFRAQVESMILSANDIGGLLTCVLRPCNAFGPGEKNLVPLLETMAQSSWAKFILGSGDKISDFTYVDNIAHALICAEESLCSHMVSVCGKVFFITNLEPMKFSEFSSFLLTGLDYQSPVINFPAWMSRYVIFVAKFLHQKSDSRDFYPCLTDLAFCTRTFNCLAAQKYLQYSPVVSMEEGLTLTVNSASLVSRELLPTRCNYTDEPSKIERLLGCGKVADILLWRNEKQTFFCFILLAFLYQWFLLSKRTLISSLAELLLVFIVLLSGNQFLPLNLYGLAIPKLSSSSFEISEVDMRNFFGTMTCMWNGIYHLIKSLSQGTDLSNFIKVSGFLYVCKLIVPHYLTMAIGVALVLAFTLCFTYQQYEKEIDGIAITLLGSSKKIAVLLAMKLPKPLPPFLTAWLPLEDSTSS